jgi:hypothetical protein
MRPSTKLNLRAWLPSRGNVIFSLLVGSLVMAHSSGLLPMPARTAEGAPNSRPATTIVRQVNDLTPVSVGPAHAQTDDLTIQFASYEIPSVAYDQVEWHATVYDTTNTGCRPAAGVRLDGSPGGFPDMASYQELSLSHTGLLLGEQAMSGSTVFQVSPGAHTLTLVLMRAVLLGGSLSLHLPFTQKSEGG